MASNVIPFPRRNSNDNAGDPPPHTGAPALSAIPSGADKSFKRAYHAAMIASAERDLIDALWQADHECSPLGHYSPLWAQREPAFDKVREAIAQLAAMPAATMIEVRMKKRAIGNVWLKANGPLSDFFRERLAEDIARLQRRAA